MPDLPYADRDEIITPGHRIMNGQRMVWQPDPKIQEAMDYLGLSREDAARMNGYTDDQIAQFDTPDGGVGKWVPGTTAETVPLWRVLGLMAAGGAGASFGAAVLPGLIGGAIGGGGAAAGGTAAGVGAGAGAGAGTAAGVGTAAGLGAGGAAAGGTAAGLGIAGGTALPAGLIASSAVPGFAAGGTAAGLAAGGTAAGLGAAAPTAAAPAIGGTAAATGGTAAGTGAGAAGAGAAGTGAATAGTGTSTMGILRSIYGGGGSAADKQYADYIRMGLNVAGGYGQGKAAERAQQNANAAADDADNLRRYQIERENTAANFSAPGKRLSQAQYGDIVAGLQPMTIGPDGKIVGGLSPSLYSQGTRDAASELSRRAVVNALSDNPSGINQTLPTKTARAVPGVSDQIFGILGTAGGAADAAETRRSQASQTASLKELADIMAGRRTPGVSSTPGTSPTTAAPKDTYTTARDYSSVDVPSNYNFAPPDSGDEEDPTDLVNMPANRDLLGRARSTFPRR